MLCSAKSIDMQSYTSVRNAQARTGLINAVHFFIRDCADVLVSDGTAVVLSSDCDISNKFLERRDTIKILATLDHIPSCLRYLFTQYIFAAMPKLLVSTIMNDCKWQFFEFLKNTCKGLTNYCKAIRYM